jgi:hypothetical protein
MVKLVFLCRRRPDLSHDDYAARVLRGHVPLALRHHPTMQRYVVNLVEEAYDGAPPLDSIAELGFASLADYEQRLYDSPEGERIVARDVAGFLGGADAYVTMQHDDSWPAPQPPGQRTPGVKFIAALFAPPGSVRDDSVRGWMVDLGSLPPSAACMMAVVDRKLSAGGPDYDAFASFAGAEADADALRPTPGNASGPMHVYRVAEYVQR